MGEAAPQQKAQQEAASLEALNRQFRPSLTRYFDRRISGGETEDLVQEVFLRLAKRGELTSVRALAGYVFQTASSVLHDRLRKSRSRGDGRHCSFDPEDHADVDFSPEHVLLGRERLAQARAILLELPERPRTVFILRRIEDMSYREIATQLGISVSSVEKDMLRAVRHLAARMEQEA